MSIIPDAALSAFATAVSAADEKLVQDGYGHAEKAMQAIANAPKVSEADRAAALERLATNGRQLAIQLETAESVEEAIAAIFGSTAGTPGAIVAANSDVVADLTTAAKASLGTLSTAEAISRSLVAKGVLDGTFPVAGDQPEAVAQLTAANAAKAAAETAKTAAETALTDAETALTDANTAHDALIAKIKAAMRPARAGNGQVIDLDRLPNAADKADVKAALGI